MAKKNLNQRRILVLGSFIVFVPLIAFLVIRLAQGYRPDFKDFTLQATGVLVAKSEPDGAQLFINDKLTSATNTTLNLSPDEYQIEIKKDGFSTWQKTLPVKKELVTKIEALLFPTFPTLRPLTFTGTYNPIISPDGQRVVFIVSKASSKKDGLWVLELADRPLGFNREPKQILQSLSGGRDLKAAQYLWSPDSKQILLTFQKNNPRTSQALEENFLLDPVQLILEINLTDISLTLESLQEEWAQEAALRQKTKISKLPDELLEVLENATKDLVFSPDQNKILYTATATATIPEGLIPPLPAANFTKESRNLQPGKIYTYDLKEDRNFYVMEEAQAVSDEKRVLSWFPTSRHLFYTQENKVTILEYDNTNWVDVYSGPFENSFAFPFPDGAKILISTTLDEETPPNLYAVDLR